MSPLMWETWSFLDNCIENHPTYTPLECKSEEDRPKMHRVSRCLGGLGRVGFLSIGWIDREYALLFAFLSFLRRISSVSFCALLEIPLRMLLNLPFFQVRNHSMKYSHSFMFLIVFGWIRLKKKKYQEMILTLTFLFYVGMLRFY